MSVQAGVARTQDSGQSSASGVSSLFLSRFLLSVSFCLNILVMASSAHSNFRALSCRTGPFEANANAHFCATGKEYVHEEMEAGVPHRKEDAECLRG